MEKVFIEKVPSSKFKQQLYEYAAAFDEPVLATYLLTEAGFSQAKNFPVFETLNLKLVKEFTNPEYWQHIDFLLASAGMEAVGKPVAARAPQQESLINARKATPFRLSSQTRLRPETKKRPRWNLRRGRLRAAHSGLNATPKSP